MKNFKKVFVLLFVALFALVLVACGGEKEPDKPDVNPEMEKLNEMADKIYLGKLDEIIDDIKLPKFAFGDKEFVVTWTSTNEKVLKVQEYADEELKAKFYQGYVEMAPEKTTLTLTAKVVYKELSVERTYEVTVLADEYTNYATIAEAKAIEGKTKDESKIKFNGVVTAFTGAGYVVSDESSNFYVYGSNHGRKLGEKVTIRGIWTFYNNMVQVKKASAKVTGTVENFDLAAYAETKTISEIAAINPAKVDDVNSTRIFKTTFAPKKNASGSYNDYRIQDPKDASKYLDLSKYNDKETLDEIGKLVETGKFYEGYVILYCSRSAETDKIWDALYVPGTAKEVEVKLTDAEKIAGLVNDLRTKFDSKLVNENLALPVADEKTGATIAWASDNEAVIKADGTFTAPAKKTIVKLTATITLNETVETLEITVTAKALETHKNYIAEAKAAVTKDPVANTRIEGVVTNIVGNTFYIQDGDSAIMVYNLGGTGFKVGDNVYIAGGIVKIYNGLYEVDKTTKDAEDRTYGYTPNVYKANSLEITEFTKDKLVGTDSALITIYNVEYVEGNLLPDDKNPDKFKASNIKFKDAKGNVFTMRTDKYMNLDEAKALKAKLDALTAGQKVSIVNANMGWFNGPQITPSLASQLQAENLVKAGRDLYVDKDVENVTIEGTVTNVMGSSYYVQNGHYAMMVYKHADHGFKAGDCVKVTGTLKVYKGLYELTNVTAEKIEKTFEVINLELTGVNYNKEALLGKDSALVSFDKLIYVDGQMTPTTEAKYTSGYKASNINFEAPNGTKVTLRTDAYISAEAATALNAVISTLVKGDVVSVKNANLGWFNTPQITLFDANQIHVNTVAKARNLYVDKDVENVTVKGVVTAVIGNTYYVQDGDYAVMAYKHADHGFVAGDCVKVTGTLTVYNGLYEIKNPTAEKITETFKANTVVLTADNYNKESLLGQDNALVAAIELEYVEGQMTPSTDAKYTSGFKGSNIKFKFADGTMVTLRTDAYMPAEAATALDAVIKTLTAGQKVSIQNCVLGWFNNPQVTPVDETSIIILK